MSPSPSHHFPDPGMNFITGLCRQVGALSLKSPGSRICYGTLKPGMFGQSCGMATLNQMHRNGPPKPKPKKKSPTDGKPFLRAVVLKTLIKKPKKPNSANRKCVRVKLSTGREATAYVPGEGHNLQEHSIVLVRGGRLKDVPGVKLKCVRGKYDLSHVKKDQK